VHSAGTEQGDGEGTGECWHIPAFMNALKATNSMYRWSRRKAPHMYLKIANLLAAAGGIYILVGVSRDLSESHAVWTRTDNHRSFSRVKDCAGFDTGQFVEPDVPTA
jgi:hypothetical protein